MMRMDDVRLEGIESRSKSRDHGQLHREIAAVEFLNGRNSLDQGRGTWGQRFPFKLRSNHQHAVFSFTNLFREGALGARYSADVRQLGVSLHDKYYGT